MLVLSGRVDEKIVFPTFHTAIQVLSVQAGAVRLGIEAPVEVRVLRKALPDRVSEWGPAPHPSTDTPPSSQPQLHQMVDRRLAIGGKGLEEMRKHLAAGQAADAEMILEKLDEDLDLLRGRLCREVEPASRRKTIQIGCPSAVSESN